MKRILSILIVLVMVSVVLVGCQSKAPAQTNADTQSGDNGKIYEMVLASGSAVESSVTQALLKYKEYVDEHSNGRIVVNVYPNSQLGGEREIVEGIQSGSITLHAGSSAPQVNFVPAAVIFDMPFCFPNIEKSREVLSNSRFLDVIGAKYEEAGMKLVAISDGGFRTLTANKPVKTPADLKGMSVRTMENKYHLATWKELGANPTPLAFNELYTALQQGTVDAQENPLELIASQKFYEQQDYVIMTNHVHHTTPIIMNLDFYNSLPEDLQRILDDAAEVSRKAALDYTDSNLESNRKKIEESGTAFIDLTSEELKVFADKAKNVWALIEKDCDPEVYNTFVKLLD